MLRELPGHERPDVEDADGLALDEERHAAERLDPFLAQDRIEHVRVIDVVEDHRPALCGHAACESAAERDPHAALDFLLDPDRGAGDELAPLFVEQEDRARVRLEQLGRSLEERAQELLQIEVDERSVGERLQSLQTLGPRVLARPRRSHARRLSLCRAAQTSQSVQERPGPAKADDRNTRQEPVDRLSLARQCLRLLTAPTGGPGQEARPRQRPPRRVAVALRPRHPSQASVLSGLPFPGCSPPCAWSPAGMRPRWRTGRRNRRTPSSRTGVGSA